MIVPFYASSAESTASAMIARIQPMVQNPAPGGFTIDPANATTHPEFAVSQFDGSSGTFNANGLVWTAGHSSEPDDGRESALYRVRTVDASGAALPTNMITGTEGFFECASDAGLLSGTPLLGIANGPCRWGRSLPAAPELTAPTRLWRNRRPMTGSADPTLERWVPDEGGRPFTHAFLGSGRDASGNLVTALPDELVRFIVPLGSPEGGETRDHLFIHARPIATSKGAAYTPETWDEAIGYDCPRVLADIGLPMNSSGFAQAAALHGHQAAVRCQQLYDECLPVGATCSAARRAALVPNAAHVPRNRIYLGAPAPLRMIHWRAVYDLPGGFSPGSIPVSGYQSLQYHADYRFGAGLVMRLGHLSHLYLRDAAGAVVAPPDGMGAERQVNNPGIGFGAGEVIGFVYRIPPFILSEVQRPDVVTLRFNLQGSGLPFDWSVQDRLGTTNHFANQARYDSLRAANQPFGPYDGYLSTRCPFDYFADQGLTAQRHRDLLGPVAVGAPATNQYCQQSETTSSGTRRTLRDVRGTLAGQWFESPTPPTGSTSPEALTPRLAIVSEHLSSVSISRRLQSTVRSCVPTRFFGVTELQPYCMAITPTPPEAVLAPTTSGARNGVCYPMRFVVGRTPDGMPVFQDDGYFRFVLDARDAMTGAEAVRLFRATGAVMCPTGTDLTSTTALPGEAAEGPFYR